MFWERYCDLCKKFNSSPNGVAKNIGVSNAICTKWKNGVIPKGEILLKIADFFGCSVDYLLDRTDNPQAHKPNPSISISDVSGNSNSFIGNGAAGNVTVNAPNLDDDQKELIGLYSKLSPLQKAKVMVLISDIADGKSDL